MSRSGRDFLFAVRADSGHDSAQTERQQMQRRHIPGLSIAIVDGGKIVKAKGYGVI